MSFEIRAAVAPAIKPLAEATRLRSTPDPSVWPEGDSFDQVCQHLN
jgi:hypothetical protein